MGIAVSRTHLGTDPPVATAARAPANGAGPRIGTRRDLPGGRAALGGLLVTLAAVGAFAAASPDGDDGRPTVVAASDLQAGEVLEADDLDVVRASLPGSARGFSTVGALVGRVVLGPVGAGEVVQASAVTTETAAGTGRREVALTLPPEQVAVGRLRAGDRVDVFVSYDDRTSSIVQGAEVVQLSTGGDRSITSARDVQLVVAVESVDQVAALVHALRMGAVTVVRSTFAEEVDDQSVTFAPTSTTAAGR